MFWDLQTAVTTRLSSEGATSSLTVLANPPAGQAMPYVQIGLHSGTEIGQGQWRHSLDLIFFDDLDQLDRLMATMLAVFTVLNVNLTLGGGLAYSCSPIVEFYDTRILLDESSRLEYQRGVVRLVYFIHQTS